MGSPMSRLDLQLGDRTKTLSYAGQEYLSMGSPDGRV